MEWKALSCPKCSSQNVVKEQIGEWRQWTGLVLAAAGVVWALVASEVWPFVFLGFVALVCQVGHRWRMTCMQCGYTSEGY